MKTTVLHDRVIVETEEGYKPTGTADILLKEDSPWNKFAMGTVIFAGEGGLTKTGEIHLMKVKAGDTIIYEKEVRKQITLDGKQLFHIREENIVAILDPSDEQY